MDAIYNKVAEFMTDTVVFTPKASVDKYNKTTFFFYNINNFCD